MEHSRHLRRISASKRRGARTNKISADTLLGQLSPLDLEVDVTGGSLSLIVRQAAAFDVHVGCRLDSSEEGDRP